MNTLEAEISRIELGGGQPRLKIANSETETAWIDLTAEQLMELEALLLSMASA